MKNDSDDRQSIFTVTAEDGTNLHGIRLKADKSIYSLIVVHGVGEHSKRYLSFAKKMSTANCTCYLYDQRGHGHSGGKRGHVTKFKDYSNDLLKVYKFVLLESQQHPVFVYGHSMGSIVTTLFALNHRVNIKGLILTGFPFRPSIPITGFALKLIKRIGKIVPLLSIPTMINVKQLSHDENVWKTYKQDRMINKTVTCNWVVEFYSALAELKNNISNLELPLLIMHGSEDKIAKLKGVEQAVQLIHSQDKTFQVFKGQRHELLNELPLVPDLVIGSMRDWVQLRLKKVNESLRENQFDHHR